MATNMKGFDGEKFLQLNCRSFNIQNSSRKLFVCNMIDRVEVRLGQVTVIPGSSGSDLVYKTYGSDPDSALDHMH